MKKIRTFINEVKQKIEDIQIVLRQKMLRNAMAYYQHLKKLAEEGDEKVKKIFEDLEPEYKKMLKGLGSDN